jgi:hypothetical protein
MVDYQESEYPRRYHCVNKRKGNIELKNASRMFSNCAIQQKIVSLGIGLYINNIISHYFEF